MYHMFGNAQNLRQKPKGDKFQTSLRFPTTQFLNPVFLNVLTATRALVSRFGIATGSPVARRKASINTSVDI